MEQRDGRKEKSQDSQLHRLKSWVNNGVRKRGNTREAGVESAWTWGAWPKAS